MESKSHFLAHFIPGILLGSVVGLAFGSLLVATQIPRVAQTNPGTKQTTVAASEETKTQGPLVYQTKQGATVSVYSTVTSEPLANWLNDRYSASIPTVPVDGDLALASSAKISDLLQADAQECGNATIDSAEEKMFSDIADKLVGESFTSRAYTYSFTTNERAQAPLSWEVYAIPNVPGFKNLDEFKAAMDICAAGGIYPSMVSADWLVFTGSCGSGFSDGSGLPIGCTEAENALTIEFAK